MNITTKTITALYIVFLLTVAGAAYNIGRAQGVSAEQEVIDRQIMLKTSAQLENIRKQFQDATAPIVKEQNEAAIRLCGRQKLSMQDCMIDGATGAAGKRPPATPAATAPVTKK